MSSKCKECGGPMKPLFVGEFCPNDCDKPEVLAKRKAAAAAQEKAAGSFIKSDEEFFKLFPWMRPKSGAKPVINYATIKKAKTIPGVKDVYGRSPFDYDLFPFSAYKEPYETCASKLAWGAFPSWQSR